MKKTCLTLKAVNITLPTSDEITLQNGLPQPGNSRLTLLSYFKG